MCDPAIKLFGKTIALPSHTDQAGAGRGGGGGVKGCTNNEEINTESKPNSEDKCDEPITSSITTTSSTADRETQLQKPPPSAAAAAAAAADDDDDHHHHQEEEKDPKTDQEEEEEQQQDEKPALKKPDKILPCPRCNSMDTKFCYYNNYNVNQPRHFCKNCQRYWTAGGTMRNVPVGAGRRKNKNAVAAAAAAHYRHLMTMTDAGPALKPKGTVLSFGSDMPLSESMASVLDLAEKSMKKKKTCNRSSGFQRMQEHVEEQSTGSSATNSNSAADDEGNNGANLPEPAGFRNCQGLPPHLLYIGSSSPWPYPWNPPPPTPPTSAPFCGSTFPIPIYPAAAYWGGCSAWSMPWLAPLQGSPSPTTTPPGCGPPNSPTTTTMLGKHTREGNVLHRGSSADTSVANEQSSQEKCLWIPKTLRIDDPEEAAKSSIWATMGFSKKNDRADGFSSLGGGLFRSFQTKTELWSRRVEASQALHANPAALSRSIEFQESS